MADELDAELATALLSSMGPPMSPSRAGALLKAMQAAGWLTPTAGPSACLRWSDPARPVVLAALSEQHPDLTRRLNDAAADWTAEHGSPERALRYAAAAQSWSRVVLLVESHWPTLLYRHPGTLTRILKATPPAIVAMSALVSALTELLPVQPRGEMALPPLLTEAELASVARSPMARSAIESSLAAMVVLRRRGSFAYAHAYSRQLAAIQLADPSVLSPQTAGVASLALTQTAILAELSGESDEAISTLREAFRWVPASLFSFSESEIAARLAVSYARLGLLRQASDWLEHLRQAQPVSGLPARTIHGLGHLAEAITAIARLDADRAAIALSDLGDRLDADEYWPFVIGARVNYALAWGTQSDLHAALATVRRRAAGLEGDDSGVAGPLLANAEVDLLLALGRGNEARAILGGVHHRHPLVDEPRVRLALLTGDNQRARELALAALDRPVVHSPIQRLEMALLMAVASHRLGRESEAADALRRAVYQANLLTMLQPFARLPRADLLAIAEHVPGAMTLLEQDRLVLATRPATPIRLVTLNGREQFILEQLTLGRAASEIATTLKVSINTVRSQRRGLYRKLGAASRVQAIRIATDLGLISG